MRRFTATALSLIIMLSAFGCAADSTATAVSNAEYKVSGSLGGYGAYIADYSSYGFPDAEITVLNKEIQLDFNSSLKADFSVEEEGLYSSHSLAKATVEQFKEKYTYTSRASIIVSDQSYVSDYVDSFNKLTEFCAKKILSYIFNMI